MDFLSYKMAGEILRIQKVRKRILKSRVMVPIATLKWSKFKVEKP